MSDSVVEGQVSKSISDHFSDNAMASDPDGSIEVTGTAPSFDDFDRVEQVRATDKNIKKEKAAKEEKSKKEDGAKNEDDGNKAVPSKGTEDEKATEEVKGEETKEDKPTEEITPKVKTFTAKLGDKSVELTGDEIIDVKVNGKLEQVKISDLKANYSGKVQWDRKFTEIDRARKQALAEKDELYRPLENFKKLVNEGKSGDALLHLVDFIGEDSYNFSKKLIDTMTPIIRARLDMSPEQLAAHDYRLEVEHLRNKEKSASERAKIEQSNRELNQRTAKLQETYSISDDDFRSSATKVKEALMREGKFDQNKFTPELVADFYLADKAASKTFAMIDQVDKSLANDSQLVNELTTLLVENPKLSDEEVKSLLYEYAGIPQKLKTITQKAGVKGPNSTPQAPKKNKVEFFEDYDG